MSIRTATMQDTAVLARMNQALTQEMSRLAPATINGDVAPDPAYFAKYLLDPASDVFVSVADDQIAGFALVVAATTQDAPEIVPHRFAYCIDLYVAPAFRRQGRASALMAAVFAWAKPHDCEFVELNVLGADTDARAFYQHLGFTPQQLTLTRRLGD